MQGLFQHWWPATTSLLALVLAGIGQCLWLCLLVDQRSSTSNHLHEMILLYDVLFPYLYIIEKLLHLGRSMDFLHSLSSRKVKRCQAVRVKVLLVRKRWLSTSKSML
jgi:hypothetical protein